MNSERKEPRRHPLNRGEVDHSRCGTGAAGHGSGGSAFLGRRVEDVGAQLVALDSAFGGLFDGLGLVRRNAAALPIGHSHGDDAKFRREGRLAFEVIDRALKGIHAQRLNISCRLVNAMFIALVHV